MILSCSNISRSFGDNHILKRVSFHIEEHEKAAVVGINGAGKSTLLKIIIGDLAPDEGSVTWAKGASIGYLAQHQDLEGAETIYDALLEVKRPILEMEERLRNLEQSMKSASGEELEAMLSEYSRLNHAFELENGYACRSEITGVLKGLGFQRMNFQSPSSALRRPENPCILRQASLNQTRYPASGRAHQPSGYGVYCMAGNLFKGLFRKRDHRGPRPVFPGPCGYKGHRAGQWHRHCFFRQLLRLQR